MANALPALLRTSVRRTPFWVAAVAFVMLCSLPLIPIFRQPGYELATALGIALAFLGGLPARAIVGAARRMAHVPSFGIQALASTLLTLALPLPAILIAVVAAGLTTPCNPFAGFPFVALIVPSAAIIASSVGLLCALNTDRFRGFLGLYLLAVVASAVATAWPILAGPQVFAFNVFAGYFPGPIYDESLHVTNALLWARLETLLLAGAALSFARARFSLGARGLGLLLVLAVLGIRSASSELGLETTNADVDAALGGLRTTPHFRIHYPRERSAHDVEQLARDLEFRYAQDTSFLGVEAERPIDAYFYRSPQEKQRWVGAAETDFAKPWLHQFHVQLSAFPDPVAKHELAHVLAAPLGSGPFRVCAWLGLFPNPAIIEGLATAADNHVDELTLPEWSHAMRELNLAPDLRQLLRPTGFFAAAPARAYTLSGAFLRYLVETYGREKLRVLYPHGDFQAAYGKSLDALVTEWERAVDAVPLDAHARTVAAHRFSQPSLFGRTCAREEARLREELDSIPTADHQRALALTRRLQAIAPDDLDLLRELAERLRDAGDLAGASQALKSLLDHPQAGAAQRAQARQLLGTLAATGGNLDDARNQFREVLALQPDGSTQRSAEIHLAAFDEPKATMPLLGYFEHPNREDALLDLRELVDAAPGFAPARYLIGRRLTDAQLAAHAVVYLRDEDVAALRGLPATHDEALKLRARNHALTHRCSELDADAAALLAPTPAALAFFHDWHERCDFEVAHGLPVLESP